MNAPNQDAEGSMIGSNRWMVVLRMAAAASVGLSSMAAAVQREAIIDASYHPLGSELRAVIAYPDGHGPSSTDPACIVVHGSGGLFAENEPGEDCGPSLEPKLQRIVDTMTEMGVVVLLPSSFAGASTQSASGRDPRFCEDSDADYFNYVGSPMWNAGDGEPPDRDDDKYKSRRIAVRTLDLLAASDYICSQPGVDCERTCMFGTSNGASSMLAFVANDLPRHLTEYMGVARREHESTSGFEERTEALANMPAMQPDTAERLASRPLPRFAHAIAPGCRLRSLVPTIDPADASFDPNRHSLDLYYPADGVELDLEIGALDNVSEACYAGGIRELQAGEYERLIDSGASRYVIRTHQAGHDLLEEVGDLIHRQLRVLIRTHLFGEHVFADGFDVTAERK